MLKHISTVATYFHNYIAAISFLECACHFCFHLRLSTYYYILLDLCLPDRKKFQDYLKSEECFLFVLVFTSTR